MRLRLVVVIATVLPYVAQAQNARAAAEVAAATDSLFAAAGRADINATMALFAPGLHADNGALRTREQMTAQYGTIYAGLQRLEFTRTRTTTQWLAPNVALVETEGPWRSFAKDGTPAGSGVAAWTLVWQKSGGKWTLANMHQSFAPPNADVAPINTLRETILAAENAGRADDMVAASHDDIVVMPPNGPAIAGRVAVGNLFRQYFEAFSANVRYTNVESVVSGDWGFDRGTYSQTLTPKSGGAAIPERGKYLWLARRGPDGVWKYARVMWNSDEQTSSALTAQDSAAIRKIADEDESIVRARNWDALVARYSSDAIRMPPNGLVVKGRDAIRAMLEQTPPISAFTFRLVDLKGEGNLAYIHGVWSMTLAPRGKKPVYDSGKILAVMRKQPDGSWLTVADAWNSDLEAKK